MTAFPLKGAAVRLMSVLWFGIELGVELECRLYIRFFVQSRSKRRFNDLRAWQRPGWRNGAGGPY